MGMDAVLVRDHIIHVSTKGVHGDLASCPVEIDRRMVDFIVGLDSEMQQLVDGSHLYLPQTKMEAVVLPEETKILISKTVQSLSLFKKSKHMFKLDETISSSGLVMLFYGDSGTGKTMTANAIANLLGKKLLLINFPSLGGEQAAGFIRMIFRESKINDAVLFFDECESIFESRDKSNQRDVNMLLTEIERHDGMIILATNRPFDLDEAMHRRITLAIEFQKPDHVLRRHIWTSLIPSTLPLSGDVDFAALAMRYELSGGFIKNAILTALSIACSRAQEISGGNAKPDVRITQDDLARGAQLQLRGRLAMRSFERRIVPRSGLEILVCGPQLRKKLQEVIDFEKSKTVLYGQWGFGGRTAFSGGQPEIGSCVLFYGPPGTGKSLAAQAIGFEVGRALKVVNSANIVDKYVGETGKNIEKVFAEARSMEAILVFDEAEGLFGRRNAEAASSVDKHANLDSGLLLYWLEHYPGLCILTTNARDAIDSAFFRRFRFMVEFSPPDRATRAKLWEASLPKLAPRSDDVDFQSLASEFEKFSGGDIQNAVIRAASRAALRSDEGKRCICMADLREAARTERSKADESLQRLYVPFQAVPIKATKHQCPRSTSAISTAMSPGLPWLLQCLGLLLHACHAHTGVNLPPGFMESLPMPHQGPHPSYYISTTYPLSCEGFTMRGGLESEKLPWSEARKSFRDFVAQKGNWDEVSKYAWDLSSCWCSCGSCATSLRVCPVGTMTALNMKSMSSASRMASFINQKSTCSHLDPYALILRLPPWSELILTGWPTFGVMHLVAVTLRADGLMERHLDDIFAAQLARHSQGPSWRRDRASNFCELLGYRPDSCPLRLASDLVWQAVAVADMADASVSSVTDAAQALVRRAQEMVLGLLPRVPGISECMQAQNLFLGISMSSSGLKLFDGLHQLQMKLENWLLVPPKRQGAVVNASKICPVGEARWQGEWLMETDFLKDFQAELDAFPTPKSTTPLVESPAKREAWVCTLFAGPELPWAQIALHAEVVRTLAFSIRRKSRQQRPFVVLTQATIPEDIRKELLADGLRLEYFHAPSLVMKVPRDYEWKLSWFRGRNLVPTMGQLAVWNLSSYDTLVMLDDDMLMVDSADELFTVPVFAMSHDPLPLWSPDDATKMASKQTRLNNAARVVQPNKRFFQHLVRRIQSGDFKDDPLINFWGYDLQSLEDAFWNQYGPRKGVTNFVAGKFSGCAKSPPGIATLPQQVAFRTGQWRLEASLVEANVTDPTHCVLPADYNFFVDFKSVFSMVYFGVGPEDLKTLSIRSLMKRLVVFLYRSGSLMGSPKILHWPGSMRKPWERLHERVRSGWDQLWWEAHEAMCKESPAACRISCDQ
eukprot:s1602_g11.t1